MFRRPPSFASRGHVHMIGEGSITCGYVGGGHWSLSLEDRAAIDHDDQPAGPAVGVADGEELRSRPIDSRQIDIVIEIADTPHETLCTIQAVQGTMQGDVVRGAPVVQYRGEGIMRGRGRCARAIPKPGGARNLWKTR